MVQPTRYLVLAGCKGEQSAIFLKLVHDELVQGEVPWADERVAGSSRIDSQNTLQPKSTRGSRQEGWRATTCKVGNARNHWVAGIVGQRT